MQHFWFGHRKVLCRYAICRSYQINHHVKILLTIWWITSQSRKSPTTRFIHSFVCFSQSTLKRRAIDRGGDGGYWWVIGGLASWPRGFWGGSGSRWWGGRGWVVRGRRRCATPGPPSNMGSPPSSIWIWRYKPWEKWRYFKRHTLHDIGTAIMLRQSSSGTISIRLRNKLVKHKLNWSQCALTLSAPPPLLTLSAPPPSSNFVSNTAISISDSLIIATRSLGTVTCRLPLYPPSVSYSSPSPYFSSYSSYSSSPSSPLSSCL